MSTDPTPACVAGEPDTIPQDVAERIPFFATMTRLRVLDCRVVPGEVNGSNTLMQSLLPTDGPELDGNEIRAKAIEELRARGINLSLDGNQGE